MWFKRVTQIQLGSDATRFGFYIRRWAYQKYNAPIYTNLPVTYHLHGYCGIHKQYILDFGRIAFSVWF